jgi:hypothetical protein
MRPGFGLLGVHSIIGVVFSISPHDRAGYDRGYDRHGSCASRASETTPVA